MGKNSPVYLNNQDVPTVVLTLRRKPKTDRKVQWTTGTVDNEDMDKKKSKCCCIYKKPRAFDESSSSDSSDDECDHCQGHVEKKNKATSTQTPPTEVESKPVEAEAPAENAESKPEDAEAKPVDEMKPSDGKSSDGENAQS